jgi:pilus assembly protein Flp/PilA
MRVMGRAEETNMMLSMITRLQSIVRREEGQDLLEYALLVALIALVAVGAITLAGKNVNTIFGQIATALTPSA